MMAGLLKNHQLGAKKVKKVTNKISNDKSKSSQDEINPQEDFDVYEPKKKCLELLKGRLGKGSVIRCDELNFSKFPGEIIAFDEVLGRSNYKIVRSPITLLPSFIIID